MNHHLWAFALTSLLLNLTPGNDMIYVASRSAGQGIRAGIVSAMGIMVGCLVHLVAAVAGISALIAGSATAFQVIKYVGAAYLVWLGMKSLLNRQRNSFQLDQHKPDPSQPAPGNAHSSRQDTGKTVSLKKIFWQGVITNVLNPKVALFFLAFLPQFIDRSAAHPGWQIFLLGAWFDVGGTVVNMLVAILFGKMGNWLSRSPRVLQWQEKITGLILVALGIKVAFTSNK